jgi:Tol biopolymer transport system component
MRKIIGLTIILMFILPNTTSFAAPLKDVKAAFIREGDLWLYLHEKEKKITTSGKVIGEPQWSHDGKYVAYQMTGPSELNENAQETAIWIYDVKKDKKQKIFHNAYSPSWAPKKKYPCLY